MILFWSISVVVFVLDRITKIILTNNFLAGESFVVIEKIFSITFVKNTGSAFGLFPNATQFFIWTSLLTIILITIFSFRMRRDNFLIKFSLALVMGGAMGNLFDRLCFGYVIDFLDFRIWPVFNAADSAITAGCVLLAFKMLFTPSVKGDKK